MIPYILHQIWIGKQTPPDAQKELMLSNKKILGDKWVYKLWTNEDLTKKNFPNTWKYIQKSFTEGKKRGKIWYAQISDLMRYEILYHYGGMYMDAGIQLVKPMDDIINIANLNKTKMILCNQDKNCDPLQCGYFHNVNGKAVYKKYISNSFIACVHHSVYMTRAVCSHKLNTIDFTDSQVDFQTGPSYLRSTFKKSKNILVLPTNYIYPFNWYEAAGANLSLGITKSFDKCISRKKPKQSYVISKDQIGRKIYVKLPCKLYPDSYAIKHWNLGGSWVKK